MDYTWGIVIVLSWRLWILLYFFKWNWLFYFSKKLILVDSDFKHCQFKWTLCILSDTCMILEAGIDLGIFYIQNLWLLIDGSKFSGWFPPFLRFFCLDRICIIFFLAIFSLMYKRSNSLFSGAICQVFTPLQNQPVFIYDPKSSSFWVSFVLLCSKYRVVNCVGVEAHIELELPSLIYIISKVIPLKLHQIR